jgi:predicted O-methyltransferase YrrM
MIRLSPAPISVQESTLKPDTNRDGYAQAVGLCRINRFSEAVECLRKTLANDPANIKAELLLQEIQNSLRSDQTANSASMPFPLLTPSTLANIASRLETWNKLLEFHAELATDDFVRGMDAYYREGVRRFGENWNYRDIINTLFAASSTLQPKNYLEIGVRRGRSLCVVARGCPQVNITAFDMWMANYAGMENPGPDFVRRELSKHGHQGDCMLIDGDSHITVPEYFGKHPRKQFDLMTVDGDHSEDGAWADLLATVPHLAPGGILVFDDIAHPTHPYLYDVWKRTLAHFTFLKSCEYTEAGYGVAFAIRNPG